LPIGTPGAPGSAFNAGVLTTFGTSFNLLGRATADGNGSFVPDAASAASPVKRTLLGTYTVNLDCTGTAVLIDSATGTTRNISFVLVNELPASVPNSVSSAAKPSLRFVFVDPGVIGSGASASQ
jgi:hypothetical protein